MITYWGLGKESGFILMKECETSIVMTCEGKKGRRQGLDERRKGDLYMKLFLQFSVFTIQT